MIPCCFCSQNGVIRKATICAPQYDGGDFDESVTFRSVCPSHFELWYDDIPENERIPAFALTAAQHAAHPEPSIATAAPAAPTAWKMTVWSGSPCPKDPDNYWIDDVTGERVSALTGERTKGAFAIGDTVRCLCRVVDDCSPDFEKGEIYTVTADSVAEYQRLHAAFEKVDPPTDVKKE